MPEMFDRILLTLGRLIKHPTDTLKIDGIDIKNIQIFYSENYQQAVEMAEELENLEWIKIVRATPQFKELKITPEGWQHLAKLREARAFEHSDKVFLAMWFNESTNNFREAVKEAVNTNLQSKD